MRICEGPVKNIIIDFQKLSSRYCAKKKKLFLLIKYTVVQSVNSCVVPILLGQKCLIVESNFLVERLSEWKLVCMILVISSLGGFKHNF